MYISIDVCLMNIFLVCLRRIRGTPAACRDNLPVMLKEKLRSYEVCPPSLEKVTRDLWWTCC